MRKYLCGCVLPALAGTNVHPVACIVHGRIAEPLEINVGSKPTLRAVLFTDVQLTIFADWLAHQTFPYDQLAVAQAARAVIARANTLTKD